MFSAIGSLRVPLSVLLAIGVLGCSSGPTDSSASPDDDPLPPGGKVCAAGLEACGGRCVDSSSNPAHCGGCDLACPAGKKCQDGACVGACAHELVDCDGACVDLAESAEHCGGCGLACEDGASCVKGSCESLCPVGETRCAETCVDTDSDPENCGACGETCSGGLLCSKGRCVPACDPGLKACGKSCVDIKASRAHCGSCAHACGDQQVCNKGLCILSCGDKLECDGRCVDIQSDPDHCGICNWTCPPGTLCQGGECACPDGGLYCEGGCVDPKSDRDHCGACGESCGAEELCVDGKCACPNEMEMCNDFCTDTDSDPWHCGGCNITCWGLPHADGACVAGKCELDCSPNFYDCNENRTDGCEAYILADEGNCGGCGIRCADMPNVSKSLGCDWGVCSFECKAGWGNCDNMSENGCETSLLDVAEHCGTCYNSCHDLPSVETGGCSEGKCTILLCEEGRFDCDQNPVNGCESDVLTDIDNCGACGNKCAFGCKDGKCVGFAEIGAGSLYTCAATGVGKLWCWGDNNLGWLGSGSAGKRVEPFELNGISGVTQVEAGSFHTCALTGANDLYCWGNNQYGMLGDGTTSRSFVAKPIATSFTAAQVAVGSYHTCALDTSGEVWCWGRNHYGQLGDGTVDSKENQLTPKKITTLEGVQAIRSAGNNTCALTGAGEVYCWGTLGYSTDHYKIKSPKRIAGALSEKVVLQVETGHDHACARTEGGELYCWGENEYGQLGAGSPASIYSSSAPVLIPDFTGVVDFALGDVHSCALKADDSLWCWGLQDKGRLGDGLDTSAKIDTPIAVTGAPSKIQQLRAGGQHTCLLDEAGELWCWGNNSDRQLGVDHVLHPSLNVPTRIPLP